MCRPLLYAGLLLILACAAAGCAKPQIQLAVASQPNVNPDHSGRPSPVIVKMYELRNDLAFTQADFQSLFEQPLQTLGSDLVAADELIFVPGEARKVAYQPAQETKFVGFVAGFRQMDRATWRSVKPVDPESKNWYAFELNDVTILMIPDEEADDWDPEETVRSFQQRLQQPKQVKAKTPPATDKEPPSLNTLPEDMSDEPPAFSDALEAAHEKVQETVVENGPKETVSIIDSGVTSTGEAGAEKASALPSANKESSYTLPSMRPY